MTRSPTHRRLRQRHADPHAHRRRPSRRQGLRVRARRRRLPHQAVRAPRARAPPQSARPQARLQQAACARARRCAAGSVSPRGPPRRPLRRADRKQFAVLESSSLPKAVSSARRSYWNGRGIGTQTRSLNAVRITVSALRKRLGEPGSSPPWPAPDTASTRNQTRCARRGTVDGAPGLSVRLKLTLSYAGFLMVAGALMLAAVGCASCATYPTRSSTGSRGSHPTAPTP